MMETVLLENELYSEAMTDLVELREIVGLLSVSDAKNAVTQILNKFEEAASIAGHCVLEKGIICAEIVNGDPETFREIIYGEESES
jgi:hypothetical protein